MVLLKFEKLKAVADAVSFPLYRWAVQKEFFKRAAILASLTIFALNGRRERRLLFLIAQFFAWIWRLWRRSQAGSNT